MYFFDSFDQYSDRTAFLQDDGTIMTYEQLQAHADWIGNIVPARSLVFILCENTIGSAAGYLAFLQNRSGPLLLDAGINQQL